MEKVRDALGVLLADDDEAVRASIRELLSEQGFRTILEADSGLAALDILQKQPSDVAFSIMDVEMPGMTGIEVLRAIRSLLPSMPCIFVTGDASRERQVQAMEAGGFSLLTKPVSPDLLLFSVKRLLDHHYGSSRLG